MRSNCVDRFCNDVYTEKNATLGDGLGLRCAPGLYENVSSSPSNVTCAANPPDCGTLGQVKLMHPHTWQADSCPHQVIPLWMAPLLQMAGFVHFKHRSSLYTFLGASMVSIPGQMWHRCTTGMDSHAPDHKKMHGLVRASSILDCRQES